MNYFETINKGGVVLCGVCNKKITETGTALNDIPVHIKCYHRESEVENRAKELYPIPVRGTYSEEAQCRTNRIAYTKGYMDALRVNQGTEPNEVGTERSNDAKSEPQTHVTKTTTEGELEELDYELIMLEDVLHGEEGKRVTKARKLLAAYLSTHQRATEEKGGEDDTI
jgi:hypothetical protein